LVLREGPRDRFSEAWGKYQFAPHFAWTLMELNNAPDDPLSDHAPITVDIPLTEPPPR
jgi:hypothetical protein